MSAPTSGQVLQLLPKFSDADSDLRYMSLNDLYVVLTTAPQSIFNNDFNTCARAVDALLKTLDDSNGDVQSQAIKCLGPLAAKAPPDLLAPFIEKLSNLKPTNSLDASIPATSLRNLIVSFPRPIPGVPPSLATQHAYAAISKVLVPRLLGYIVIPHPGMKSQLSPPKGMLEIDSEKGVDSESVDVLIELVRCFGPMLHDAEKAALQKKILEILNDKRTRNVIKKKAVIAISVLAVHLTDSLLNAFISDTIESFRIPHLQPSKRRLLVSMIGSLTRSVPQRLGPYLQSIAPFILSPLSKQEYEDSLQDMDEDGSLDPIAEEVKEAALVTLEALMSLCSSDMQVYTDEAIECSLRYVKYNPSLAMEDDDEAMETEGSNNEEDEGGDDGSEGNIDADDEDFEEEGAVSDDDDASWKIRRCATKVLYAIISTRNSNDLSENWILYERVAPVLISCFKEQEENVRLEVLSTLAALIRRTRENSYLLQTSADDEGYVSSSSMAKSRKRRRDGSDASMRESMNMTSPTHSPSPTPSTRSDLSPLGPSIIQGTTKLLNSKSLATKQAATTLLRDFVLVQPGALSEGLSQIINSLMGLINSPSTMAIGSTTGIAGPASVTGTSLRIEALRLIGSICDTHNIKILSHHVKMVLPGLLSAAKDKYFKISSQAIRVIESLVRLLTPPRSSGLEGQFKLQLSSLFDAVMDRASASGADIEVRQVALHAIGLTLARTSERGGVELLSRTKRFKALSILSDRLKNETTRVESIQAIDTLALSPADRSDLKAEWIREIILEIAGQLRKSDRILRGTSLRALKHLLSDKDILDKLDSGTIHGLFLMLLPLLEPSGLDFLNLALRSLANLVQCNSSLVVNEDLNNAICDIVLVNHGTNVQDALLVLVNAIGSSGAGQPLMQLLLKKVGITGEPAIVGAAIGSLLVSGGTSVGIRIEDFIDELHTAPDDRRKSLALSVLGEAGLHLGKSSPLQPTIFLNYFKSKSEDLPRAAAVALGRAGAGDVPKYLPIILANMKKKGSNQYLLLRAIKEILQHAHKTKLDISDFTAEIWQNSLTTSEGEDNKAVGAECIGRLISIEPKKYFPLLQTYLKDPKPAVRGMVIQAVRFAFTDTDREFDRALKPILVEMLITMLNDPTVENRRLALTTLNSATNNKAAIVLPHIHQLLPFVIKESIINPELIREVTMGPFKHKVDDGLEVRKSAYETLNALMDTAFARMNSLDLYDRVTEGLSDEHDIKILCNLMITKLLTLTPEETSRHLDSIAARFQAILSFKPKENAVKQEIEKAEEASKAVLKTTIRLHNAFPGASGAAGGTSSGASGNVGSWRGYWEWVSKEFRVLLQSAEGEIRSENA